MNNNLFAVIFVLAFSGALFCILSNKEETKTTPPEEPKKEEEKKLNNYPLFRPRDIPRIPPVPIVPPVPHR